MKKSVLCIILISYLFTSQLISYKVKSATATVPLSVTVNGSLLITNADNDSASGKNPTINVDLKVTPDLGQATVTGNANFRIRSNYTRWRLTSQRTASNTGGTGLTDNDISLTVTKVAGNTGNINSGTILSPFTAATNLTSISTVSPVNVISGIAKTSSAKDGQNKENYFQVNTKYGVNPDFFYTPGTYSTTITYNLVSP